VVFADSNDECSWVPLPSALVDGMKGSGVLKSKSSSSSKSFSSKYTAALCRDPKVELLVVVISIFRLIPREWDGGGFFAAATLFPRALSRVDWSGLEFVAEWSLTAFRNMASEGSAASSGREVAYREAICGFRTGPFERNWRAAAGLQTRDLDVYINKSEMRGLSTSEKIGLAQGPATQTARLEIENAFPIARDRDKGSFPLRCFVGKQNSACSTRSIRADLRANPAISFHSFLRPLDEALSTFAASRNRLKHNAVLRD